MTYAHSCTSATLSPSVFFNNRQPWIVSPTNTLLRYVEPCHYSMSVLHDAQLKITHWHSHVEYVHVINMASAMTRFHLHIFLLSPRNRNNVITHYRNVELISETQNVYIIFLSYQIGCHLLDISLTHKPHDNFVSVPLSCHFLAKTLRVLPNKV